MDIYFRSKRLQLNDPRCYNRAYFDAEYVGGAWRILEYDILEEKRKFV